MNTKNRILLGTIATLVLPSFSAQSATVDFTQPGGAVIGTSATINGAIFTVANGNNGAGTGNLDAFLRTQKNTFEKGYNTDGALEFDQKAGPWTHSLTMGELEVKNVSGIDYFRLLLDVNQTSSNPLLTLHKLELYVNSSTGADSVYADGLGVKSWELDNGTDNTIELDFSLMGGGSGVYDIEALFPIANFGNFYSSDFFYLYNEFGNKGGKGNAANGEPSNDGFEEWAVVTYSTTSVAEVPLPTSILLLGSGVIGLLRLKRK